MPARSRAQQRLMQAAEHGATFPAAKQIRGSMTEKGKPEHVPKRRAKADPNPNHESHSYDWRQRQGLKRGSR